MNQQTIYCNTTDELDEELTIDLKKIFFALWARRELIVKVFAGVFIFFILLTFILPKKYTVTSDLYINKANTTNLVDVNPYAIEELGAGGGMAALMGGGGALADELELIKSPLVLNEVIRGNDIRIGKVYGIFPTRKTGQYVPADKFLKKIAIENKKGTKVVSISFKSKKPELAYNVVSSIITNYIALHKELHSKKAKSDKQILEKEYKALKQSLNDKVNTVSGLPDVALGTAGNLSAMGAFSKSAQSAMSQLREQIVAGQKSRIEVTEEAQKYAEIAKRLQWAKMVEEMSDSSKVLVLKEPNLPKVYEQTSPKLFTNIILGIVFGVIASLFAVIYVENANKKLTYSMLGENIVYNIKKDFSDLKLALVASQNNKISLISFNDLPQVTSEQLKEFNNISVIAPEISTEFVNALKNTDEVMLVAKIGETDSKFYKQIKTMLKEIEKNITKEILV